MSKYNKLIGSIAGTGVGAAAITILSWLSLEFGGLVIPTDVEGALEIIVVAAFSAAGVYFAPANTP